MSNTMTLTELNEKIVRVCRNIEMYDSIGDEHAAESCCDYVWDLRVVRQSMERARAINLRARLRAPRPGAWG